MSLKILKKVPTKGIKWPCRGPLGPLGRVIWGAFSGHLRLLDVILDRYAATGTNHGPNVSSNVEIWALVASFCAILAVFWAVFAPLGPFGPFLGPFGPL